MFRTEIPLTPLPHQLPPSARVLTLGSCFSDSIGSRLTDFKVATLVNPFGTVFNPISACKLLRAAAGEDVDWQQHLVEARGRWQSYDLHAEIGADSPVDLLQHISQLTREVGVFLATADVVILTLGSAYAYRLRETDELVSNCHKVPAEQFEKELLTADDIIAAVAETHAYLRRVNPKLRFVLTVSPVRHLKDTLVLNSASKAMLRVACHYLSELLPDVTYFPAYELLVDDLRDYRFYATDMLHLSESAENYVWEKFTRTYFDTAFGRFKKEWEGIRQNLGHRPLHPAAPEHRAFLETTLERLRKLSGTADVRMELLHVERELANLPALKSSAPVEEESYDDGEERIDIGSFDDQAALDVAQPIAAVAMAVAASESISKQETGKKDAGKKEIRRAVFAQPRLTSQASLLQPGSGLLVEDAEENEIETEDTETTDATVTSDSAYDHAYSPTVTDLTDEAEGDADDNESDEADESEDVNPNETVEEAARRKKRRSRGGAKRTKRKHARLAAEQADTEGQPEASAVATAPAPLPDEPLPTDDASVEESIAGTLEADDEPASEVVYVTEAELRQPRPRPETTEPATEPTNETEATPTDAAQADDATAENRRGRNNRRGNKREQAPRYGGRPSRQPLYAVDTDGPAPADAEQGLGAAAVTSASAIVEPVASAPSEAEATSVSPPVEVEVAPAKSADDMAPAADAAIATSKQPTTRKRPARAKSAKKSATEPVVTEPTTPAEPMNPTKVPVAASEPVTVEPAAAPAKPTRRKPAAKPKSKAAASAAVAADALEPVAEEAAPAVIEAKASASNRTSAKPKTATSAKAAKSSATRAATSAPASEPADVAPVAKAKPAAKVKAPAKAKTATTPKPAAKKAPAKAKSAAKPTAATDAAPDALAAPAKPPTKSRAKAAVKPAKETKPKA